LFKETGNVILLILVLLVLPVLDGLSLACGIDIDTTPS